jgi:hypothetical protein
MSYRKKIKALTDENPGQVEAWMRNRWGPLDFMSPQEFHDVALEAAEQVRADPVLAAKLAATYGLN